MHNPLNESTIEHHAIALFKELSYTYAYGPDIGPDNDHPERADYENPLLLERLRHAIHRLNPEAPKEIRDEALRHVQAIAVGGLMTENSLFQQMLVEGVRVAHMVDGEERGSIVRLIDYDHPEKNDLLVVNQYTVIHNRINRRADLVVFVNGMPLGLFELKNMADANATIRKAWNQLQTYQADIPNLMAYNAVLVISDGLKTAMGCLSAPYERFLPWKTIDGQELMDRGDDPLRFLIHGVFAPRRFLDLLRYFIAFEDDGRKLSKKIAAYHQFHAAQKALLTTLAAAGIGGDRRGGVVWHTQGSGKSLTMLFFAGMLIQHPALENPTILMLTDRTNLDTQLFDTFAAGKPLLRQDPQQADSVNDLRELLQRASGGVLFSTIQKFQKDRDEPLGKHPVLSERKNIIVMVDEAQRSQYEILKGYAANLRAALPNATFVAFTGTPLELDDRDTRVVFGDYIDIYDIQRAVEDGATVPIYYESRLVRLNLPEDQRPLIDSTFEEITEDDEQENKERLKTRWAQLEALVGAPKRVEQIAADLLDHWEKRKSILSGKAMIVAMSRRIAVELYDAITALRPDWHSDDDAQGRIKVVMTGNASDPIEWKPHIRSKAGNEAIADRLKDPDDPLEIVIVRDMWLTGFDAPALNTLYVDKPMRGHTLMQAIARVNRVFTNKSGGLVVDYIGIAQDLKNAIATYTRSGGKGNPAETVQAAIKVLLEKLDICRGIFHGLDYQDYLTGDGSEKVATLRKATEFILPQELTEEGVKRRFRNATSGLKKAATLAAGDDIVERCRTEIIFFLSVRATLDKSSEAESLVEEQEYAIRQLIDQSIAPEGVVDLYAVAGIPKSEISLLSDEFIHQIEAMPEKNLALEMLRRLLQDKVRKEGKGNLIQSKAFSEKLEEALRKYHNRSVDTVEVMQELIALAKALQALDQRHAALGLSKDEAAFYDALATNDSAVQAMGDEALKMIAKEVADTVRQNTRIDWSIREQARAHLRRMVKRVLRKHGYPPDMQEGAVNLVIEQAEGLVA
ncbi:type I restriction endonuclease subunit R [Acidithiobacillus ferrooxidans]|uniref:type I restriction endonuclease subunit R n=1 Tax=Acidithiobacillus ferrooxidans TaxID=920 RepID=UPI001C06A3C4|nr:type I restriction endonuclease subunit R [Acidithiobacillus ferrooxidans]MBU2858440.1 type I restriction endonuclease subunit R [Acidithiobacillus ferrooxidans]MBU2861876.1 type I restriction endonuclease subunit R [Acidithiobacillus ferrooxidans]